MSTVGKKRYTLPIALLLLLVVAGLGIFYYVNHILTTPITFEDIQVDSKAALKLNALEQVSKKNGITEWELKASSATLLKDQDTAILKDVEVTFYTEEGDKVELTADNGTLDTESHDIVFSDNVIVVHQGYTLRSETLQYDKKPHIIHTDSHVTLEDENSIIEGDSMKVLLNKNQVLMKGNIKGNFSENSNLP